MRGRRRLAGRQLLDARADLPARGLRGVARRALVRAAAAAAAAHCRHQLGWLPALLSSRLGCIVFSAAAAVQGGSRASGAGGPLLAADLGLNLRGKAALAAAAALLAHAARRRQQFHVCGLGAPGATRRAAVLLLLLRRLAVAGALGHLRVGLGGGA